MTTEKTVYVDKIKEVPVYNNVDRIVQVPVEKIVEVDRLVQGL